MVDLKTVFDYQRFCGNRRLERLILETGARYGEEPPRGSPKELTEEQLDWVNAAGKPDGWREDPYHTKEGDSYG